MKQRSYLVAVGLLALFFSANSIADLDPNPTPTECPSDSIMPCDGIKVPVGLPYFACSGALYFYPDGTPLSICCQYECQQMSCIKLIPPGITFGLDMKLKMTRAPSVCNSTPLGQSCDPVILP